MFNKQLETREEMGPRSMFWFIVKVPVELRIQSDKAQVERLILTKFKRK